MKRNLVLLISGMLFCNAYCLASVNTVSEVNDDIVTYKLVTSTEDVTEGEYLIVCNMGDRYLCYKGSTNATNLMSDNIYNTRNNFESVQIKGSYIQASRDMSFRLTHPRNYTDYFFVTSSSGYSIFAWDTEEFSETGLTSAWNYITIEDGGNAFIRRDNSSNRYLTFFTEIYDGEESDFCFYYSPAGMSNYNYQYATYIPHNIQLYKRYDGPEPEIIEFADEAVKAICVANWDDDRDGELSKEEAAAVTTLDGKFTENAEITSFEELKYFTGLTTIGDNEFYKCTSLTNIILPPTITRIKGWGLCNCSKLEHIDLPEGLLTIGQAAFNGTGLKTLFIPKNVSSIGTNITGNANSLQSIVVDEANTTYDSREGCNTLIKKSNNTVIAGCKNSRIPEGVVGIMQSSFYYNSTLKSIELPSTLTSIGSSAFYFCTGLTSVVSKAETPPTLESTYAFYSLSNCVLTVPNGTKQAYIDAGWTTSVFKGGIVEAPSKYDVNGDTKVDVSDVTTLIDKILGK